MPEDSPGQPGWKSQTLTDKIKGVHVGAGEGKRRKQEGGDLCCFNFTEQPTQAAPKPSQVSKQNFQKEVLGLIF